MPSNNRTPAARPAVDAIKQLEASAEGLGDFARGILEGVADALDFAAGQVEGARVRPRHYQSEAIAAVCASLETETRARITMACGTGKTETQWWTAKHLGARRVIVGVPSLALADQAWRRWVKMGMDAPAIAVCSDEKVGREVFRVSDFRFPAASTNSAVVRAFLTGDGPRVVFCTYHSADVLAEAMDDGAVASFDLMVCDEAHRLAGGGSHGAAFLADDRIRATRRTFWTATPKIVRGEDVVSMDDAARFGREVFAYTFSEAIRDGWLSPFRIVAVEVTDGAVMAQLTDKAAQETATVYATAKALRDHGMHRVISFHSLVARAEAFAKALPLACADLPPHERPDGLYTAHVSAEMGMARRNAEMAKLANEPGYVLIANAQCLGEGVDVPDLDGIVFADPKSSQIAIMQAVGRAIRLGYHGKVATILIPVFVPKGESFEDAMAAGRFKPVFAVALAMQAHDPGFADAIVKWSQRSTGGDASEREASEREASDMRFVFQGRPEMIDGLSTVIVGRTTFARSRIEDVITAWGRPMDVQMRAKVSAVISNFRRGKLSQESIARIESLPGWSWTPFRHGQWDTTMDAILAAWPDITETQRKWLICAKSVYSRDRSNPRAERLESVPGWSWAKQDTRPWSDKVAELASTPVGKLTRKHLQDASSIRLGRIKINRADMDKLEQLRWWLGSGQKGWVVWWRGFEKVAAAWPAPPDGWTSRRLGLWLNEQQAARATLGDARTAALESLPGWTWKHTRSGERIIDIITRDPMLGKEPGEVTARRHGCTRTTVYSAMKKSGVQPWDPRVRNRESQLRETGNEQDVDPASE